MKTFKTLGLAGGLVAAALVGGTLINAALAAPSAPSDPATGGIAQELDAAAYCQTWKEAFAAELGVSVDDLGPAAKVATIAAIDAAVANGDLPEDIATRMKEQLDQADGDGCRLLGAGFHAWGRHAARADFRFDWVTAAAGALGIEPAELLTELRSGSTLHEVATAQGVGYDAVSKAILDAAKADLDALVAAGRITQERADARLAKLTEALAADEFPRVHRWRAPEAPASPAS
jgi:hypothetical protein